jgi:hypothetical protein
MTDNTDIQYQDNAETANVLKMMMMMMMIIREKTDDVTGGWTKMHNEELHNLHSSLNIITMFKSRKIKWVEHVERIGKIVHVGFWSESQKGRNRQKNLDVGGRIILRWISAKQEGACGSVVG